MQSEVQDSVLLNGSGQPGESLAFVLGDDSKQTALSYLQPDRSTRISIREIKLCNTIAA